MNKEVLDTLNATLEAIILGPLENVAQDFKRTVYFGERILGIIDYMKGKSDYVYTQYQPSQIFQINTLDRKLVSGGN